MNRFSPYFFVILALIIACSASAEAGCGCGEEELTPGVGGLNITPPKPQTPINTGPPGAIPISVEKAAKKAGIKASSADLNIPVPDVVHPERVVWIDISQTDANRIVCTEGDIVPEDVVYSKEKGVLVQVAKNGYEAYLKLQAVEDVATNKIEYPKSPVEIYVSCAGETYGFIGRPRAIPSKTIYLVSHTKRINRSRKASLKTNEIDKAVIEIWKNVLLNQIPQAWEEIQSKKLRVDSGDAIIKPLRSWIIPGVGVLVRELVITAKVNTVFKEVNLLRADVTVNPIGITVDRHSLSAGERTRAVILEKVVSNEF